MHQAETGEEDLKTQQQTRKKKRETKKQKRGAKLLIGSKGKKIRNRRLLHTKTQ